MKKRPEFYALLTVFEDKPLAKRIAGKDKIIPLYGFRLILSILPTNPVSCGIVEWQARHCNVEETLSLAETVAKAMNIKIDATSLPWSVRHCKTAKRGKK